MHHNDLKCREIVDDFCYIQNSFVLGKSILGLWANLGLLFIISEYGLRWNQMDIISPEMDSITPKTPDNMYHT